MQRIIISEVNKRRLLIGGLVIALVLPVLTLASLASNPSGTSGGTTLQCSDLANLEVTQQKNCTAYEAAKAGKINFDKKLQEAKVAYEAREQQGCTGLSDQALAQCNQEIAALKQAYDTAGTVAIKAMLEEARTKNLCNSSTTAVNELKNRCSGTVVPTPDPTPDPTPNPEPTPPSTNTDNDLQVCDLTTKQVVTIKESQFNTAKYSKNLNFCLTSVPTVQEIRVCDLTNKKLITIKEADFDAAKHSKNLGLCVAAANELPQTGPAEMLAALLAVTVLTAAAGYLISSRKPGAAQNNEVK